MRQARREPNAPGKLHELHPNTFVIHKLFSSLAEMSGWRFGVGQCGFYAWVDSIAVTAAVSMKSSVRWVAPAFSRDRTYGASRVARLAGKGAVRSASVQTILPQYPRS